MSEQWRLTYDRWKTEAPDEELTEEEQEERDAQAEAAAEDRAERMREDAMFDAPEREEWVPYDRD